MDFSPHTRIIGPAELSRLLGGPSQLDVEGAQPGLLAISLDIDAGSTLYQADTPAAYAYRVEHGLLERRRRDFDAGPDGALPGAVGYAGTGDWLGLQTLAQRHVDAVRAVVPSRLLAVPLDALDAWQARSPVLAELLTRSSSQALRDDWRLDYRLRDLPPYARTVAGLSHLLHQLRPARTPEAMDAGGTDELQIELPALARWLGLELAELKVNLDRLQRYGCLVQHGGQALQLHPQGLQPLASALEDRFDPAGRTPASPEPVTRCASAQQSAGNRAATLPG